MKCLRDYYFEACDNIYLNKSNGIDASKFEKIKADIQKVFDTPNEYDFYIKKDTMQLVINKITKEYREVEPADIFNRYEITL